MTVSRAVRLFSVLILAFIPVLATAATHEFRVLIDVDNNTATGCTIGGLTGVDHVLVTLVKTDATSGAVEKSYRLACSGTSFGPQLDVDTSGWPVGYNAANGGVLVENRISFANLGGRPTLMRLGFDATSGSSVHSAIALADGASILYPARHGKRHSVNAPGNTNRIFQLDGNGSDWGAINPLVTGISSGGSTAVRMHHVYGFGNATDEFMYFRFDANVSSQAPFAENDSFTREPGSGLTVPAPGVLENDGDPNGLPLTATPVSPAAHGDVTLNADGSFTYAPADPSSTQNDSFQYKATNGSQDSNVAKVTISVSTENPPPPPLTPNAVDDSYNTTEDTPLNVGAPGLLTNDTPPSAARTTTKLTDPSHGTAVVNADGSFTYTPNPNFVGTDSFTYRLNHPNGSDTATVTITIESVNDAPIVEDQSFTIDENSANGTVVGTVIAADVDGDAISFSITGGNTGGAFAINASTGQITVANGAMLDYETIPAFTLTVTVSDGTDSSTATITITVNNVNDPPQANNDSGTIAEDGTLTVPAPGVLANDSDPEGDTMAASKVTDPANGVATVNANGGWSYQPNPNFFGTDSFTYQVSDGSGTSNVATVTITVTPVNDTPSFTGGGNVTSNEDTPYSAVWATFVSAGPSNESTQTLTFNVSNNNNAMFSVQPSISPSGVLSYTPAPNANGGPVTVTVTLSDNGGGANTTAPVNFQINITPVNDAPSFTKGADQSVNEDTGPYTVNPWATGISAGPADESGQTLTFNLSNDNNALFTAGGQPAVSSTGVLTYTLAPNASGVANVTITLSDNGGTANGGVNTSAPQQFVITVNAVNDAPVNTVPGSQTTPEDTPLALTGLSVSDIDAGASNVQVTLTAINGTLTITASVPAGTTGNGTATIVMTAPISAINAALANLRFDPAADYFGPAQVTITTNDQGNTGSGGALSDTDNVAITVTEVNDAPVANADAQTTPEDTPLAFAAATLTVNDSKGPINESAQTLTVTGVSATSAQGGTVTLVAGTITYTPPANYNGPDSFTYTVTDNGTTNGAAAPQSAVGTVNVTVTEVNDAPTANADAISTPEDTPSIFAASTLALNDSAGPVNEGTQTLTVTGVSAASAQGGTVTLVAGTITYTPPVNYSGADSFTYTVTDNGTTNGAAAPLSAVGTVNVTVTAVNDAPILTVTGAVAHTEGGAATNLATAANITDVDDTNIESATIQITGNFAAGQDILSFVNTPNITGSFVGDTLTLTGTDTLANYIAALQAVQYTNTSDTPSTLQRSITWTVNDGTSNSNTQVTTLNVTATNDAPVNNMPGAQTTAEDTPLTLTGANAISISDPDSDPDDVQVTLNVTNGTVQLNAGATGALTNLTGDGTATVVATGTVAEINAALNGMTFSPTVNYTGAASIQIVTDDLGNNPAGNLTDTDTLNITVTAVNDAPVLTVTGAVTHTEGGAATNLATAANITDVDDTNIESATIQITGNYAGGQDVLSFVNTPNITGSFVGDTLTLTGTDTLAAYITALQAVQYTNTSDAPSTLQRTITWTVSDGTSNSNTQTTTLDVTATNDAPVNTAPAGLSTNEDTPLVINGATIADADADPDDVQITLNVTNGTVTLDATATGALNSLTGDGTATVVATGTVAEINAALTGMTFSPAANYSGTASIQMVTDDLGNNPSGNLTDTDSFNITVNAVNDAPVLTVTGSPTFAEDGPAVAAATVTINDVDDTNVESATISITANFSAGDTLNFVNTPNITGNYVAGTLTLTGSDTLVNYTAALQSITFSTPSDTPSTLQRTLTWVINDGNDNSNTQTTTVDVTATNDAPVLTTPASVNASEDTPFAFTGGNTVSVTDPDSAGGTNFQATLSVSNGTLSVTGSGVTGNGTASVTITGTVAAVNTILGTLQYTGNANYSGGDTLAVNVTDNGQTGAGGAQVDSANITINIAAVNDAPVLTVTGSPTFAEGGAAVNPAATASINDVDDTNIESATVNITGNFVGDTLTLTGSDTLVNYAAALQSITFSNNSDNPSILQRTITWTVNDGTSNSNTQATTVDVTATNDAPVNTVPAGLATNEDTPLVINGATIADADADPDDVQITLNVTNGTVTLDATATGALNSLTGDGTATVVATGTVSEINAALTGMTFTPTLNFSGTASIQMVTDDQGNNPSGALTDTDSFNITVNAVNDAPVNGVPGTQTFNEDTTLTFSSGNGNAITVADVDAAAGNLTVTLSTTAGTITLGGTTGLTVTGNGTNNVQATGTLTDLNTGLNGTVFTPTLNLSGAQTISMSTTDNGNTGSGGAQVDNDTINLSITAVNDAPVNALPASPNVDQDSVLTMSGAGAIQISDIDAGANTVQVTLNAGNGTMTLDGTAGLSFAFSDGNGTGAGDGTADATMTFRGTIANINAALDGMTFTPTPLFFGTGTIQIITNDLGNTGTGGALTDSDTLNITVNQLNQAPVNTVPGLQTFNEDTTLVFSSGNGNLISIADPDAGVATVQVTLTATNGTMTLSGTAGLSFVFADGNGTGAGDGTADATMTFRGTIANINTALSGMSYTPNLNYSGAATLTITTNDLGNTGPGGPKTDTDVVNLSITAVNDAPVLTNPASVNATEDVQFSFTAANTVSVTDADSGAGTNFQATLGVTSGTLNVVAAGAAIVGGNNTNSVTITGTVADVNSTLASLKYTGNLNFNGTDTLAVNVTDNGQTGTGPVGTDSDNITINVSAVNDAPVNSVPGLQTFNEDTTLTFSTGNGNAISVSDVDVASGNMTVTLTTTAGTMAFGSVAGLSAVTNNAATITGTGTLANINNALQGLVFTPTLNLNGAQTISLTISDLGNTGSGGTLTDNDNITLSITAVNDAPVLTNPVSVNATEDVAFNFTNTVSIVDVDAAPSNVQVSLTATNGTVSLSGTAGLSFAFSDGNGTGAGDGTADTTMTFRGTVAAINTALTNMTFTGTLNFNGTGSLAIVVNDLGNTGTGGPLTDSDTVTVNVAAVNDPPVALDKVFSAQAHMRINGLTGLLTGVTDVDNGTGPGPCVSTTFTVANVTPVTGGTIANLDTNAGTFDFLPAQNFSGTATLTYTVQDSGCPGSATSAAANININVAGPVIYFVKSVAVGTADCRLGSECTLATAIPLATAAANRHIFISDANTHTPGLAITLNTGGHLMGQGVTPPVDGDGVLTNDFDDLFDITPPTGTIARPAINAARPTVMNSAITLNASSQLRGLNLNVNAGTAVASTGRTGLKITDMNVVSNTNAAGTFAIDLGTSSGDFTIGTVSINAGRNGSAVRFATTTSANTVTIGNISTEGGQGFSGSSTGATNFSFGTVTSTTGAAVTTNTSSGNFTFGNITSTTGAALSVTASGAGDFTAPTVTSTTGTAVSVTTATGDFTFTAINSNGAAKGVSVNSLTAPGTFTVNGTATTDGTGGTIQNATSRGMEFISSANITLKNMNLTNNGVGGADNNCADALGATTNGTFVTGAACESNLHLQAVTTTSLNNLNITQGDAHGINGYQVNGLTMTNMLVELNGDMVGEDGVQLVNTSGTVSLTGSNIFRDNAANQFEAQNGSGSPTFSITGAYFGLTNFPTTGAAEAPSPASTTANSGLVISASGTANMTATVTGSTFEENYANGYLSDSAGSAILNLTIGQAGAGNGNTFTNNGVPLEIVNTATGSTTYSVVNNIFSNDTTITGIFATTVITASRSGAGSVMTGTIDSNIIGSSLAGATASGCFVSLCNGIELTDGATSATNRYNVTVTNNQVNHVQGGITSNIGGAAGSPKTSFLITGNIIRNPDVNGVSQNNNAILINSGTDPTATPQTCVEISGNTLNGAWGAGFNNDSLRLRHRGAAGSTFRIRNWDTSINYDGIAPTGDAADAMRFLENNNTFNSFVDKTGFQLVGANVFTGGTGACP